MSKAKEDENLIAKWIDEGMKSGEVSEQEIFDTLKRMESGFSGQFKKDIANRNKKYQKGFAKQLQTSGKRVKPIGFLI